MSMNAAKRTVIPIIKNGIRNSSMKTPAPETMAYNEGGFIQRHVNKRMLRNRQLQDQFQKDPRIVQMKGSAFDRSLVYIACVGVFTMSVLSFYKVIDFAFLKKKN
ncbi:hypothetical protein SNEBB_002552 [Seison nebaliae]|nr:hypothetical protein SNEBB_002552 [Seison nebaliae]